MAQTGKRLRKAVAALLAVGTLLLMFWWVGMQTPGPRFRFIETLRGTPINPPVGWPKHSEVRYRFYEFDLVDGGSIFQAMREECLALGWYIKADIGFVSYHDRSSEDNVVLATPETRVPEPDKVLVIVTTKKAWLERAWDGLRGRWGN